MKLPKFSRSRKKGFSLVEVLLALAVLGMAILAIVGLLNASFASVTNTLQMSQAMTVRDAMDRSLRNVNEILDTSGKVVQNQSSMTKSKFNYVYDWVKDKKGTSWNSAAFFIVFSRNLNEDEDDAPQMVTQVMYCEDSSDIPSKDTLDGLNQDGNAYLVRAFVSPELEGQYVSMSEKGEMDNTKMTASGDIPSDADRYALNYLPLTLEIYPLAIGVSKQNEDQYPIFTDMVILTR